MLFESLYRNSINTNHQTLCWSSALLPLLYPSHQLSTSSSHPLWSKWRWLKATPHSAPLETFFTRLRSCHYYRSGRSYLIRNRQIYDGVRMKWINGKREMVEIAWQTPVTADHYCEPTLTSKFWARHLSPHERQAHAELWGGGWSNCKVLRCKV